jgi:hypothetical protein
LEIRLSVGLVYSLCLYCVIEAHTVRLLNCDFLMGASFVLMLYFTVDFY